MLLRVYPGTDPSHISHAFTRLFTGLLYFNVCIFIPSKHTSSYNVLNVTKSLFISLILLTD